MKKRALLAILFVNLITFLIVLQVRNAAATVTAVQPADIYIGRRTSVGIVSTANLSIYGPNICTAYGDPFSPLNSPWAPGLYTYHYRILIPPDYPSDVLRVELFDPDSINQAQSTHAVSFTANAHALDPTHFPLGTVTKTCSSTDRRNACLIQTGELSLVDPTGVPPVLLDQINPYWFVRIDENRGYGAPPGNGMCGMPGYYNPAFNTSTLYELFYYAQNPDRTVSKIPLANYTGQTGDGVRDNGDHLTDMHWVSPGGTQLYDQPTSVPVDPGSPGDFELNLSQDLTGIAADPVTGERYVYLDITTLSGASENGFDIWAGPLYPDISSDVNIRNIQVLDNPSSHNAKGVVVSALEYNLVNSNYNHVTDIPLTYVSADQAGQPVYVSLYDTDSGAQPPVIFYLDTIAESDWSLTFGTGVSVPDPDGISGRCLPGACNNLWVDPPYQIQMPDLTSACDPANPDQQICTPFYGGRLMAHYIGGSGDTYAWQVNAEEGQPNPTAGCSAFPIGVNSVNVRSVSPPGTGSNPYPDAADFDYPATPPQYEQFIDHEPDMPIPLAKAGSLVKVDFNTFRWLVWNTLYLTGNPSELAHSLAWPGDSLDYPFNGYYEPGDPTDRSLHVGDWIEGSDGSIGDTAVQQIINEHIDLGRVLRLPTWDNEVSGTYRTSGFALFRVLGYSIADGWLLLEFMGRDESCGQLAPADLVVGAPELAATLPITAYAPVDFRVTITNTGDVDVNSQFYVDIFLDPTGVTSATIPYDQSGGFVAFGSLAAHASRVITITASAGFANGPANHQVYAMVDTLLQVDEENETNNVSAPLTVNDVILISPYITLLPNCGAGPNVQFAVQGFDWPQNETINLSWDDALQSTISTGSSTSFSLTWQRFGLTTGSYEVKAAAENGLEATAVFTIPCSSSPTSVTISGPATTFLNVSQTFTATVSPLAATQPLTYTWEATSQPTVIQTGGITNTLDYTWTITGTKTITVTVENGVGSPVTTTHPVEVVEPRLYYLPVMLKVE
ncbi:MAG: hypothetical protein H6667_23640 [Ardenticatenaceae bacterium]|nr:hypothetical protein [Ardenticatenaceae bacterium]MCB9445859.1 hypothetical protein [Ardenticatenaceae bacterium]